MALPVAVQLYSVRDEMQQDVRGTLRAIKDMGYQGVEFAGLFGYSAKEMKALLAELGLKAVSAHVPLDEMLQNPQGVFALYREIGCSYIAIPYVTEERRPGAVDFEKTVTQIRILGEHARVNGLTLLYHNHDFEFVSLNGNYGLDVLYRSVDTALLQTEIDCCWVKVAGLNPADYVRSYQGRAPVVHLKDYFMKGDKKPEKLYALIGLDDDGKEQQEELFGFRPLGAGLQDIPSLLAASEEAGAAWVVVEQDEPAPGMTRLDSVRESRAFLHTLGW